MLLVQDSPPAKTLNMIRQEIDKDASKFDEKSMLKPPAVPKVAFAPAPSTKYEGPEEITSKNLMPMATFTGYVF